MSIPDEYLCPITRDIMINPVILIDDGYSYEESVLKSWLENHNTSPMTNNILKNKTYTPNRALKSLIYEFNSHQRISSQILSREFLTFNICSEWFDQNWKQKPRIKIILSPLGSMAVGKTILCQCLRYGHWPENMIKPPFTLGKDMIFYYLDKLFREEYPVVIQVNDLPGQERFEAVTNLYFRQCHGAFLVTDTTDLESLERLEQYWYPKLKELCMNHVQTVLVCTKSDLFEKQSSEYREMYLQRIEHFATTHQIPLIHVSAYRGDNVTYLFKKLIIQILENDALINLLIAQANSSPQKAIKLEENSIKINNNKKSDKKRSTCCN
ncbi:hypothetical protein I4U23_023317 [Adineta vaga]|nr:hypothetical protein I4U23_023317 [Adineta vaga]